MCSFCPLLFNGQVPLPGEVVVLVIVGEEGLVVVGASGQHAFGSLLEWSQELILFWPRPVAADHKCGFIHWEERNVHQGESLIEKKQTLWAADPEYSAR